MEEELYLINHLTMITGLSDRTIRNYIASGILNGEKINGMWHFTPEEVDAFIKKSFVTAGTGGGINGNRSEKSDKNVS